VRFIAATHRDLQDRIAKGHFRQDLFFRLNGISLQVPPLRERLDEIEPLALQFATAAATAVGRPAPALAADAVAALRAHDWPGNIRELRNVMERAVLLGTGGTIDRAALPIDRRSRLGTEPPPLSRQSEQRRRSMALHRDEIIAALGRAAGNQKVAAQMLGISRRTLINKLEAFAIARPRKSAPEIG
jgi:DNA-binding NtrC family response regulator